MFFAVTSWASLTVGITYWLYPKFCNANFVLTKTKCKKKKWNKWSSKWFERPIRSLFNKERKVIRNKWKQFKVGQHTIVPNK